MEVGGRWVGATGAEVLRGVAATAAALEAAGVGRGDRVAVIGPPHPAWMQADFAILALGAVTVGIYPTLPEDQVEDLLRRSGAKLLLSSPELLRPASVPVLPWELPQAGPPDLAAFRARCLAVRPDDVATLIWTSGTTGPPKGVVLTHRAFVAVAAATQELLPLAAGEASLVFLPLAHSLQRLAVYRGLMEDAEGWFVPRVEDFVAALPAARPTILASVPRMLEKMKARIEAKVAEQPPARRRAFAWAMAVGRARSTLLEAGRPLPLALRLKWRIADRIFAKVRAALGGRLRSFACGGARLDPEVARFFHAMGIDVLEAWGLSETCAPATMNCPAAWRFGTVGRPLPGVEIRRDADGELLVRGPGLFAGYFGEPEATAAVMTADGFFRTGDIGEIDPDGFVRVTDRKKEILVTSGGKNIPPVNLEKKLEGGAIGQAVVIGDDRPYLVALFAPEPDFACADREAWAAERVAAVNRGLAPYEQIKRWAWLDAPLSEAAGHLTPTQKLRRKAIAAAFADRIDALYR